MIGYPDRYIFTIVLVSMVSCSTFNKTQLGEAIGEKAGTAIGSVVGDAAGNASIGANIGSSLGGATGGALIKGADKQAITFVEESFAALEGAAIKKTDSTVFIHFRQEDLFAGKKVTLSQAGTSNIHQIALMLSQYPATNALINFPDENSEHVTRKRGTIIKSCFIKNGIAAARVKISSRAGHQDEKPSSYTTDENLLEIVLSEHK